MRTDDKRSPYYLDMMDYLLDLQRDGLVKSIAGKDFSTATIRAIEGCGYHLDSHRSSFNMLTTDTSLVEHQLLASDVGTPNIFSNPLAGGLLTDRFAGQVFPLLSPEVGPGRHKLFINTLQKWARIQAQKQGEGDETIPYILAWNQYQNKFLPVLQHIALKYRVSIASVALRWTLQLEQSGGTIVGFDVMKEVENESGSLSKKMKSMRDVFRFELDDEDLEAIRTVSSIVEDSWNSDQAQKLDLDNPKLWL